VRLHLPRLFLTPCEHQHVMVVRSAGLERIVCENCGHVSFSFDEGEFMSSELMAGAETDS